MNPTAFNFNKELSDNFVKRLRTKIEYFEKLVDKKYPLLKTFRYTSNTNDVIDYVNGIHLLRLKQEMEA